MCNHGNKDARMGISNVMGAAGLQDAKWIAQKVKLLTWTLLEHAVTDYPCFMLWNQFCGQALSRVIADISIIAGL